MIHVFYVYEQFQATSKGYMYLVSAEECLFLSVKPLLLLLLRGCLPWKIITTILTMASIELLPAGVMMQVELSGKMMKLLRVLGRLSCGPVMSLYSADCK